MSKAARSDSALDGHAPASGHRVHVPDKSMLAGSENAPPAAVKLLNHAVQGAHEAIDHLADRAAPVAQQLGDSASAAQAALRSKAKQLRSTRDEWVEGVRSSVRSKPLVALAGALVLGAAIARLTRRK
jgi:hypothetical protein